MTDTDPRNELGTGSLPAATEQHLTTNGYVYAATVTAVGTRPFVVASRRPIVDIAADMLRDVRRPVAAITRAATVA